jgi:hexosaminidase
MLFFLLLGCTTQQTTSLPISLAWEMGQNGIEPGIYENTLYIKNTGKTTLDKNWILYYTQQSPVVPQNSDTAPLIAERIMSTFFKLFPSGNYQPIAPGETLAFTFRCKGNIIKEAATPSLAYIVFLDENGKEGQPQNIAFEIAPFEHPYQWTRPGAKELPYPDGNYMYAQNEFFNTTVELDETAVFPSLKAVETFPGTSTFSKNIQIESEEGLENEAGLLKEKLSSLFGCVVSGQGETIIRLKKWPGNEGLKNEQYELNISNHVFEISGVDAHAVFDGTQTLLNIIGNAGTLPAQIADKKITDYPDTDHRGFMLDVARNFTAKDNLLKLIDILSLYKINVLHWHLTDDEAWRVEIPGLEELTTVGAHRGHTLDESACLYPSFSWGWDASDNQTLANGYYSRNEFIEILKYAAQRHVKVIPEVDMPGHSRAAIKAMNARYHKYIATDKAKAEEYLLADFADTSVYLSAQSFTDNVLNMAMPSAYRFIEKVIDEIDKMYIDAGLKLEVFHIGGDEVPKGAWEGSQISLDFMKAQKMTKIRELKDYFIAQILPILSKRNIQPAAWNDVVLLPDNSVNEQFTKSNILSYCWNTIPTWGGDEEPYKLANAGYPIILCNVTNLYFDMAYNRHQQEPGLYWGGFTDEFNSFDMLPYDIYKSVRRDFAGELIDIEAATKTKLPLNPTARPQIKGLQGILWAETVKSFEQVEYYLFPKIFGLAERAWNTQPEWAQTLDNQAYEDAKRYYNAKISEKELPRLSKLGVNFRVAQPGIVIREGRLYANSSIPDAEIRYTTDGSEPTEQSSAWKEPVACDAKLVKAKAFYLGKTSVTTRLYQ